MEPLLDANGEPLEGPVERKDADGNIIQCRLWRGFYVIDFTGIESRLSRLHGGFQPRPDDVLVWAYVKCGTHWLHEICHFLLTRQCVERPINKEKLMLEFVELPALEALPSPRILNCHLPWPLLPRQVVRSSTKIICPVRNPKDVAVSLYYHYTRIGDYKYRGRFEAFLAGLFEAGTVDGGSYFEHTELLLAALASGQLPPDRVHLVEYEKLKSDTAAEILRLDRFLMSNKEGASAVSDDLLAGICRAVGFDQMRRDRGADMGHLFAEGAGAGSGFYRKGDVGDWRHHFDEAASVRIDALVEKHLAPYGQLYRPTFDI